MALAATWQHGEWLVSSGTVVIRAAKIRVFNGASLLVPSQCVQVSGSEVGRTCRSNRNGNRWSLVCILTPHPSLPYGPTLKARGQQEQRQEEPSFHPVPLPSQRRQPSTFRSIFCPHFSFRPPHTSLFKMSGLSEYIVILAGVVLAGGYFFRDSLFGESKSKPSEPPVNTGGGDSRDFVSKMKATVRTISLRLPYFLPCFLPCFLAISCNDLVAPRLLNLSGRHDFLESPTVSTVIPGYQARVS